MNDNLLILAGGMSSRMKSPSTSNLINKEVENQANVRSKSLISVGNQGRPLMDYLLYNAKKAGYKNIYIVINEKGGLFKEFYGKKTANNNFNGLNISFATQYIPTDRVKPFGTADAVFQAIEQFKDLQSKQFTVCNSDNLYSEKALRMLRETSSSNAFISYNRDGLEFSLEKILKFAVVQLDRKNYLQNIIEKPSLETANSYKDTLGKIRVSMNIFKLDGKMMYPYLKNCPVHPVRDEKELPSAILNMVKEHSNAVLGIPLSEHVPDLTAKDDIIIIKEYLKKHYPTLLNWAN
ncbi:glucose-1-phosphate adenylyltransferase [Polaribacter sp. KT25b]|uniref:sugar phosphate nucleotidyltransferase n=1 Tax=Polaribacter sp. KT25b TaxID=1855336 RepID=UPI00087D4244|nr:sugar phosphate nucleotidyltransferase [Polaribacter sp. KT25b]SDS17363.1 glucose-1-phosphate adenylyltransferase [Polaribacter sp. KT25b]